MRAIAAILAALFIGGCGSPNINFGNENLRVTVYDGGSVMAEGAVGHASRSATELKKAVSDPRVQWEPSIVTYAPEVFFRNSEIKILLLKQAVVLESNDGGGHFSQWEAPMETAQFQKIRGLTVEDLRTKESN